MTLISNIRSMVDQLEQINSGEANMADDTIEVMDEDEYEDDKKMMAKSDEGPTANDDADERLETTDEESEKNIQAVKALIRRMDRKIKTINKSASARSTEPITQLTRVVKTLVDRLQQVEQAQANLLEGLGVGEQIEKSLEQKAEAQKPVQSTDVEKVLKSLLGIVDQNKPEPPKDRNEIRKSLADRRVLSALFQQ